MTVVKVGPRIGTINGDGSSDLGRLFLVAFLASCFWFWWLISLIYRFVLDIEDPVSNWSIGISILSAGVFVLAFLLTRARGRPTAFAAETLDRCEGLAYKTTLLLFVPAIGIAVIFFISSVGKSYGQGGQIVLLDQALFYVQLFFGFMFLGVVRSDAQSKRKIWLLMAVLILPRLLVSLDYGRVFVAQAVVPIVFIAVARGFIRLSWKRLSQIVLLGLFILVVPSMTRGDSMFSAAGDPAEGERATDRKLDCRGKQPAGHAGLSRSGSYAPLSTPAGLAHGQVNSLRASASVYRSSFRARDGRQS
jgi:hypothetical protein